jgi:hypothetical protein
MPLRRRQLLCAALGLAACDAPKPPSQVGSAPTVFPRPRGHVSVLVEGVPHVRQKPDFCGEAVAAAFLAKLGAGWTQDDVFAASGMDPARGMGATTRELRVALAQIGFDVGPVWHEVAAARAGDELASLFAELHADLARGVPSIVCTRYDERPDTTEHFRLVLGYDAERDEVVYHEPAEDEGAYRRMPRERMLSLWPLKYGADRWTVVRFRLEPRAIAAPPPRPQHAPADFAQHVMAMTIPRGFSVVVEPPFVVLGDEARQTVQKRSASTVRWAVSRLKEAYFSRDPERILDVWLFAGDDSYRGHAKALFGEEPDTPYGYYSERDGALVMNIATGGGTLVHEIVHPFIAANFPACPSWFNEGLGSLYEQSSERDGAIVGLTNWRLAGLQRAIRRGSVPTFAELTATSRRAFYGEDPGTNYAQARYLLYYLQEHGKLQRYYHAFVAAQKSDPTGYRTLQAELGERDMAAFQRRWEAWVLTLRFG